MPTWILVSDASRARLFQKDIDQEEWTLLEEREHPASRARALDLVSDKTGRTQSRALNTSRTAMDPRSSPKAIEAENFAQQLAEILEKGLDRNAYTSLVLVAPPQFLGLLRQKLSARVTRLISSTLDKDFTQFDARELPTRLWALM